MKPAIKRTDTMLPFFSSSSEPRQQKSDLTPPPPHHKIATDFFHFISTPKKTKKKGAWLYLEKMEWLRNLISQTNVDFSHTDSGC